MNMFLRVYTHIYVNSSANEINLITLKCQNDFDLYRLTYQLIS